MVLNWASASCTSCAMGAILRERSTTAAIFRLLGSDGNAVAETGSATTDCPSEKSKRCVVGVIRVVAFTEFGSQSSVFVVNGCPFTLRVVLASQYTFRFSARYGNVQEFW